jgi:hypothetical protein
MKITSIKFIKHLTPNCSCGTGYSEPDKFHVTCDTGFETDVWIDIWYRPFTSYKKEFYDGIHDKFPEGSVSNFKEAFGMYIDALIDSKQYRITEKDKYEMLNLDY